MIHRPWPAKVCWSLQRECQQIREKNVFSVLSRNYIWHRPSSGASRRIALWNRLEEPQREYCQRNQRNVNVLHHLVNLPCKIKTYFRVEFDPRNSWQFLWCFFIPGRIFFLTYSFSMKGHLSLIYMCHLASLWSQEFVMHFWNFWWWTFFFSCMTLSSSHHPRAK